MKELLVSEVVFEYLKPTIVVMKFFGLAPIIHRRESGFYILKKSKSLVVYSYAIALFLGVWAFLGLYMDVSSEFSFRVKNKDDIYVTLSDIGGVILSVLTGILLSPLKTEDLFSVIHSLDKVNQIMKESQSSLRRDKFYSVLFISAVYVISTSIIALDLYSWSERTETAEVSLAYIKNYLSFYLFYYVLITQQLSYNNLVFYVKKRIAFLNHILIEEILKISKDEDVKNSVYWIKVEKDETEERIMKQNKIVRLYQKGPNRRINFFCEALEEIEKCVKNINMFFDFPLMFILITCFIHIIITIWGILVSYYTRNLFLIMNIIWIVVQTGRLFFVVEPIHNCLQEMSKMKPLVAKLVFEVSETSTAIQLDAMVQKVKTTSIKFTAAGIVNIERQMLSTIAGAVTTYLVILYQLHSSKRVN